MTTKQGRSRRRKTQDEGNARERILKAACEVFALYSFKAASTRMVAKLAGVEHPLIHYYFGSKEKLFEAMVEDLYADMARVQETWLEGLERMTPKEGFPVFLDRLLDYLFAKPDALHVTALNMGHIGRIEEIPGYQYITLHMARMRRMLEEKLPLRSTSREIEMFIYCFYNLIISLIGSKSCQAQLLNMDPGGAEYHAWVKDACLTLFLPAFEKLLARR